jgi:hypothetical protein
MGCFWYVKKWISFVYLGRIRGAIKGCYSLSTTAALLLLLAVQDFSFVFASKPDFNEDIWGWDVSRATTVRVFLPIYFSLCSENKKTKVSWPFVSPYLFFFYALIQMRSMFFEAPAFNRPLNAWNVARVENVSYISTFFCFPYVWILPRQ